MNKYLEMIENANTFIRLNEVVEEASFDDDITNDEYEKIYVAAVDKARQW